MAEDRRLLGLGERQLTRKLTLKLDESAAIYDPNQSPMSQFPAADLCPLLTLMDEFQIPGVDPKRTLLSLKYDLLPGVFVGN